MKCETCEEEKAIGCTLTVHESDTGIMIHKHFLCTDCIGRLDRYINNMHEVTKWFKQTGKEIDDEKIIRRM